MELMLDPSSIADYRRFIQLRQLPTYHWRDFFWHWFGAQSRVVAMGAAKGMSLEWIQENSRKAMLYREYWLLASGDVYV